jgi:general secretion pathway protein D
MSSLRRPGALIAIALAVMLACSPAARATPADSTASATVEAVTTSEAVDADVQAYLSENIHLSKDRMTIYWSLQSLSTLAKPLQPGEDRYSMSGSRAEFQFDLTSLDLESLVGVQVIKDINTVILTMKTDRQEDLIRVLDVIRTLDQPKRQVLIRVMVAEISTEKSQQVHSRIQMLEKGLAGDPDLSGQVSIDQGIIPDAAEDRTSPGFRLHVVKEQTLRSFLTMQKRDSDFEVLANPQVVVKHGEKAKIMVGSKINVVSGETRVAGNDVQIAQYSDQDIGLEFIVTPFIYGNGEVGLDISQSMTELTLVGSDLRNVETNRRQLQTFASTKSGTTVILGGMLQTRKNRSVSKVPVLHRIPVLGKLFVEHHRQDKEVDLMLFITPFILDHPEQAAVEHRPDVGRSPMPPRGARANGSFAHSQGARRGASR